MHQDYFPVIRLEVQHMKQTMIHAFGQQQLDISAEVKRALDRECHPDRIQEIVDRTAREAVNIAVSDAVKHWWLTSEAGQQLIKQAIAERMEEEAKLFSRR